MDKPPRTVPSQHVLAVTPAHSGVAPPPLQKTGRALIIEEPPPASVQLSARGYLVDEWRPRTVCSPVTHDLGCHIHGGMFDVVWMDLPLSRASLPPDKWQTIIRELAWWYRHADGVGAQAFISGLRGQMWQHPDLQKLPTDRLATEQRFAVCRFTARLKPDTIDILSRSTTLSVRCQCTDRTNHAEPLRGTQRLRRWSKLAAAVYARVIPDQVNQSEVDGTSVSRPT